VLELIFPMAHNIPQYRNLYEILRKHISDGIYKEGDLLPSENELCNTYGITRPTVRHALDALVNDGYIKKQQGKGSIVYALPKGIGILSIAGTTSAFGGKNLETRIIVKPYVGAWNGNFFFRLSKAEIESGCITLERLRLFNGKPIFYDINYLPNINLPRFTSRNFENKSLFDILRVSYRIEVKGGEQKIRAIRASGHIGKYLGVSPGHPILHLERKFDTNRIGYYFYSSIFCNTVDQAVFGVF
jgi:GntR family transcriptional regulator/GntR family frlABCD operon transcriptional regulator